MLLRADERVEALRDTMSELLSMDEPRKRLAAMISGLDIHYDLILVHAADGLTDTEIATAAHTSVPTVARIRKRFVQGRVREAITERWDECPYQLLDDVIAPIPPRPGRAKRYDDEYKRGGTGSLFILFCPARGWRHVIVSEHHGKQDFAEVVQWLIDEHFSDATCIRLVVHNLNTHSPTSLYTAFSASEARRLTTKLEWHYTPKPASWLNMVEIELSILARQCLDRRIPDLKMLRQEVAAWEQERNDRHTTVSWHFKTADARQKLERFYRIDPCGLVLGGRATVAACSPTPSHLSILRDARAHVSPYLRHQEVLLSPLSLPEEWNYV